MDDATLNRRTRESLQLLLEIARGLSVLLDPTETEAARAHAAGRLQGAVEVAKRVSPEIV